VRFPSLLAALTVLATVPFPAGDALHRERPREDDLRRLGSGAMTPEPSPTPVKLGDPAPAFSYLALDGRWARFRDLAAQGPVLLVFGASEDGLRALQAERETLIGMGVLPVAVLDAKGRAARALGERLGLTFPLVPDGRAIVASQFNCVHPATLRPVPAWFVVDRAGVVRALGRGAWPSRRWSRVAADALALPAPGTPHPAGAR
jgi:peroxiredoxin